MKSMQAVKAVGSILGMGSSGSINIETPTQASQDDSINAADELLRRRSRKGVDANLLNGTSGSGSPSASSTGQKTLLGG